MVMISGAVTGEFLETFHVDLVLIRTVEKSAQSKRCGILYSLVISGEILVVFVVGAQTMNILPMNKASLTTFICSASSNENIIHEVTKYRSTTNILPPPPPNLWLYYTVIKNKAQNP